jgi:hypothetical protein
MAKEQVDILQSFGESPEFDIWEFLTFFVNPAVLMIEEEIAEVAMHPPGEYKVQFE